MLSTLSKARRKRLEGAAGFTLIELLVVVVILGILIAIAIPVYLNYRKSANDKAAQSDLRNAISLLEVCYSDGAYPSGISSAGLNATGAGTTACGTTGVNGISVSTGTTVAYFLKSDKTAYILEARNSGGSGTGGKVYCYASLAGGSVNGINATTFVTAYADTCPA